MQNGNTTNVSINGNVFDSQIQIGTVNSNQYNSVNDNVPYEELNIFIDEIEKYRSILSADLKENGEKFCEVLDNLTHEIKNNGSYSKIKNGLETIKSFMTGMASSIAASGVLALLKNINF